MTHLKAYLLGLLTIPAITLLLYAVDKVEIVWDTPTEQVQ